MLCIHIGIYCLPLKAGLDYLQHQKLTLGLHNRKNIHMVQNVLREIALFIVILRGKITEKT